MRIDRNGYLRTDLACECGSPERLREATRNGQGKAAGYLFERMRWQCGDVDRLEILNDAGEKELGRPVGHYVTVTVSPTPIRLLDPDGEAALISTLAGEIGRAAAALTGCSDASGLRRERKSVLAAGLGNPALTADAVGPLCVGKLRVTRHLQAYDPKTFTEFGCCALSAVAVGVPGQTGVDSSDLLKGAVDAVRPDLVVVIDALAARECSRLATTLQITDTGIAPGAGIGNGRYEISTGTVGVPVLSLGVPTVVSSATLILDALERAGVPDGIADGALAEVLEEGRGYFVTPKESDLTTAAAARVIARAIETVFLGEDLLTAL